MKSREAAMTEAARKWVYERFGMADTEPKAGTEPKCEQTVYPCAPEGYDDPTAPDGRPIGSVPPKVWA